MSRKFYLAYGSNLNVEQMKYRCPGAVMIGSTFIEDYRITFRRGSCTGVANIEPRKGSRVPVGIWSITQADEKALDRYEGFPFLYRKQEFRVKLPDLRTVTAIAYIMTPGRNWGMPSPFYLHTIKEGYKDFSFDSRKLLYAARTPLKGVSA